MILTLFREQQISGKHMPHTPRQVSVVARNKARVPEAVNPRSVPERSEQTGPNLGPALAKKKLCSSSSQCFPPLPRVRG